MRKSMIEELKNNFNYIIFIIAAVIVIKWGSRLNLESFPGGESIALCAVIISIIALTLIYFYIKITIFDNCVNVTLVPQDQIRDDVNKNELIIQIKRYVPESATGNFYIKVIPNEEKIKLTETLLSYFNRDCALNNVYLQIYWKPKAVLDIIQNNTDGAAQHLTLQNDDNGYPVASLRDISSAKEIKYSMKISSTNIGSDITSIPLYVRKICNIKQENCRKQPIKLPCRIDFILGCKRFYEFITFGFKPAQVTIIIDRG